MSERVKYLLVGIVSFLIGFAYYSRKPKVSSKLNKTVAIKKDGKYFLVFNSVVVLSREISEEDYNKFIAAYPLGFTDSNVLDKFSSPSANKYIAQDGKYYEYKWDGNKYANAIEISPDEFNFLSKKIAPDQCINI